MQQHLSIVTVAVADLERARAFYRDVFGWAEVSPDQAGIAFFQLPGLMFALYPQDSMADEFPDAAGAPAGFTLAHNVNSRAEVDTVFHDVVRRGGTPLKAPDEVFWGGYSAYVAGPDGEAWEIAHNPYTPLNDDGTFGAWRPD